MSIRIEFNSDGFRQLLNSSEVTAMIDGQVAAVKGRADAGMSGGETKGFNGRTVKGYGRASERWIGVVGTSDLATMIAESEQKTLTKAVHG